MRTLCTTAPRVIDDANVRESRSDNEGRRKRADHGSQPFHDLSPFPFGEAHKRLPG